MGSPRFSLSASVARSTKKLSDGVQSWLTALMAGMMSMQPPSSRSKMVCTVGSLSPTKAAASARAGVMPSISLRRTTCS